MSSFAAKMVAALEAAMLANPMTLSASVDGQTVSFADLDKRDNTYEYWKGKLARENGTRPRVARINLGNG